MSHVLVLSIGPVQDFIATARKCRDLWFGSWLLSELGKAGARAIASRCGPGSLVFPTPVKPDDLEKGSDFLVPNKIIALTGGADPRAIAAEAERQIRDRLIEIRTQAFRKLPASGGGFHRTAAEAQVDDLIEVVWACAELRGDYAAARAAAERLLAARKNTRLWQPVPSAWAGSVPKSHLDGARESVLDENLFDAARNDDAAAERLRGTFRVDRAERLCGVGLLKRLGQGGRRWGEGRFVSTGHLAAWPLLARIQGADEGSPVARAWANYLAALENLGASPEDFRLHTTPGGERPGKNDVDGSVLFEGRVADLVPRERGEAARKALASFFHDSDLPRPDPYFAILVGDGDRMGRVIDAMRDPDSHRRLSRALSGFAERARRIVERDFGGELIYSGGDDVMAFVPLDQVVSCAAELSSGFAAELVGTGLSFEGGRPSLSVGIGISHFLEPMHDALECARDAEKLAKSKRNALAIVLDKRSGGRLEVAGHWGDLDVAVQDLVSLHLEDRVPDGAAFELRRLAGLLNGLDVPEDDETAHPEDSEAKRNLARMRQLVEMEAKRTLDRKQSRRGSEAIDEAARGKLDHVATRHGARHLSDLLIVAREIERARRIAGDVKGVVS